MCSGQEKLDIQNPVCSEQLLTNFKINKLKKQHQKTLLFYKSWPFASRNTPVKIPGEIPFPKHKQV